MQEQIFCDGIGRVVIVGGVARIDLFTYSVSETDAKGNPRPAFSHRLIMSVDGLARSANKMMEAVQSFNRMHKSDADVSLQQSSQPQQDDQPKSDTESQRPQLSSVATPTGVKRSEPPFP